MGDPRSDHDQGHDQGNDQGNDQAADGSLIDHPTDGTDSEDRTDPDRPRPGVRPTAGERAAPQE